MSDTSRAGGRGQSGGRGPNGGKAAAAARGKEPTGSLPPHWFQMLLAVADQDRHGLGIMSDVLERTGGMMKLWPGMLYRNLSKLVDDGLLVEVDAPAGAESGGGRPRFYRLTAAGRRACAAEAERLAGFVETARRKKLLKA